MQNKKSSKPLVSVCFITYNHVSFIKDAIEGFLMQKTNFPYEIIIHDDASTDGTSEIVKEYADKYPDLIVPILQKENQYSKKGVGILRDFIYPRTKGKYIAFCEGDDYWTDPLKLQKQFDFMEKYPDCSMCFHRSKIEFYSKKKNSKTIKKIGQESKRFNFTFFPENKLFYEGGSRVPSATMFYRTKYMNTLPNWYFNCPVGDMPLKLYLSQMGRIGYLDEVMGVRRLGIKGSWNDRIKKDQQMRIEYLNGMIDMLLQFNKFSNFKYEEEIFVKIYNYDIQRIQKKERESIFVKEQSHFKNLDFVKKMVVKLLVNYPYIFRIKIFAKVLFVIIRK